MSCDAVARDLDHCTVERNLDTKKTITTVTRSALDGPAVSLNELLDKNRRTRDIIQEESRTF